MSSDSNQLDRIEELLRVIAKRRLHRSWNEN